MFEDGAIVDRFIDRWRRSGEQVFGYLLGRYSEFTDVPLGIRAVVSAIYEPQQVRNVVVVNWRALEPKLNKHLWCGVVWWWCGVV